MTLGTDLSIQESLKTLSKFETQAHHRLSDSPFFSFWCYMIFWLTVDINKRSVSSQVTEGIYI